MRAALLLLPLAAGAADLPAFLAGCWAGNAGSTTFEEVWTRPAAGGLMGISRSFRGGRMVDSEFMRVDLRGDDVVFTPRIGTRQAPVEFRLKSQSGTEIVFENPAHDFPQRVIYRASPEGLTGRIEGNANGKFRSQDFPMKAVACRP
jgi:hypothetical protein